MIKIEESVEEIRVFVEGLRIANPLISKEFLDIYTGAYKYYHCLLIWRELFNSKKILDINEEALLQFEELTSDLAAAQLLMLSGMYKPARMMLRSAIENLLRVIAIEHGLAAAGGKFTFELVTLVKASTTGNVGSPVHKDIETLISLYGQLCAYVHASKRDFLALRIPFNSLTKFDKRELAKVISDFKNISQKTNRIIFAINYNGLDNTHHKMSDFILDALPKSLKKAVRLNSM